MRVRLYLLFLLVLTFQCKTEDHNEYDISAKQSVIEVDIDNSIDTTKISGWTYSRFPSNKVRATIKIQNNKLFVIYDVQHPMYCNLQIADASERFFILPNDTLRINHLLHRNNYVGNASSINDYLRNKERHLKIKNFIYAKGSLSSNAPDLKTLKNSIDSISNLELEFLENSKLKYNLPKWFVDFERNDIRYFCASVKINAPSYRNYLQNSGEIIPSDYYDFIESIPINNNEAILSGYYLLYIGQLASHYFLTDSLRKLSVKKRLGILYPKKIEYFDRHLKQPIRDYAYANLISREIAGNYLGDSLFVSESINRISDTSLRSHLLKLRSQKIITNIRKGDEAPNFHLINEQDSLVDLNEFKGKVVLLAFWATWCKPCIKEFPYENKLYSELKSSNFELISVCLGSSEELWKSSIVRHDLRTINLYANENWQNRIKTKYGIHSFPHYTIIDNNGLIVERSTLNPSDIELKQKILKILN